MKKTPIESVVNLAVTKAGSNCYRLPFKSAEEDDGEIQETTASLAAVAEISVEIAVVAVLFKFGVIFT